jgi:MFS family permease
LIFKSPQDRQWWAQIAAVSSLGIAMVIALVGCVVGGFFLDRALGTRYFFWIGLVLGILAAYRNLWIVYSRYLRDKPKEKSDQKE